MKRNSFKKKKEKEKLFNLGSYLRRKVLILSLSLSLSLSLYVCLRVFLCHSLMFPIGVMATPVMRFFGMDCF